MARTNPPETLRKLAPGSVDGDRAVQPGVFVTPAAPGVRIAAAEQPIWLNANGPQGANWAKIGDMVYVVDQNPVFGFQPALQTFTGVGAGTFAFLTYYDAALDADMAAQGYTQRTTIASDGSDLLYLAVLRSHATLGSRFGQFWSYSVSGNTWTRLADPPVIGKHTNGFMGYAAGKVVLMGGLAGSGISPSTADVTVYDIGTDTWAAGTPNPGGGPTDGFRPWWSNNLPDVLADDEFIIFALHDITGSTTWRYSVGGDSWTGPGASFTNGLSSLGTIPDGRIVLMGEDNPQLELYDEGADTYDATYPVIPRPGGPGLAWGVVVQDCAYLTDIATFPLSGWRNLGF